ncbi:MAG TPA: hypothetical protein VJ654_07630 [Noviherbaspirillum sp.]|nr:hypothetical protein [Noviherbaspirillum sp.]
MFFKVGKYQAWIEKTNHMEWMPHVERHNDSLMVWFLGFHMVYDKA